MTQQQMLKYQDVATLADGSSVTLVAWPLSEAAANSADFLTLIRTVTAELRGEQVFDQPLPDQDAMSLFERVVRRSLLHPEDMARIRLCDLPSLVVTIWEVNQLHDLIKKCTALHLLVVEERASLLPADS